MKTLLAVPLRGFQIALTSAGLLAATPTTLVTDTHGISGFELHGNGLFWWAGPGICSGENRFEASVRLRGTLHGSSKALATDCRLHGGSAFNVVRDEAYAYFFRQGVLHRKALNAAEADPSQVMPVPGGAAQVTLPAPQLAAYLELANGFLYWASLVPATGSASVREMPTDGRANPRILFTIGGGAEVREMEYLTYEADGAEVEALIVLMTDGRLIRRNLGSIFGVTLETAVTDFDIHRFNNRFGPDTTSVYATRDGSPDTLRRIDVATGDATTVYTAPGSARLTAVVTDSDSSSLGGLGAPPKKVYLIEQGTSGAIRRHALPGSPAGWESIVASGAKAWLRSDDRYIYFLSDESPRPTRIRQLPSDAPPIELRLRADALEVVQNSQDLNQSVSLVANKLTFVRAYAHLTTNTTGSQKWFPSATLRGQRHGVDLPGSPLSRLNNASVDTTASLDTLRGELDRSFLFELPASWTAPGDLTLTCTVNPSGSVPETGDAPASDNTISRTVRFIKKDRPCLVLVPIRTTAPLYVPSAPDSGLPQILARARSLLPVEDFRLRTVSEPIEKLVVYVEIEYVPCFPFVCPVPVPKFRYDPFDMADDDAWALFWLTFAHFFSSDPAGCVDTHWVGTVHRSAAGFNGRAGRAGVTLRDLVPELPDIPIPDVGTSDFLVVRMATGEGENVWDRPLGGRSLAHELGHNYGRKHIPQSVATCGGDVPKGPYDSYPFNACALGPTSGNSAIFGFDPITRSVLPPMVGGDLMSYSDTRWISKFTWDEIGQEIATASARLAADPPPADRGVQDPLLLVNGLVRPAANFASIHPSYVVPPGAVDSAKVALCFAAMSKLDGDMPYRLRFLDATGQSLGEWPLLLAPVEDGGAGRLGFVQFVPWNATARRLQVWHDGLLLAEKWVSPNAPTIVLTPPVVNASEHFIDLAWTAADPDQEPLLYTVQYSADDGAGWQTLRLNYPLSEVRLNSLTLPGSTMARLRVIASDGVNTALAVTGRFTVAPHAPTPVIAGVVENQRVPFGAPLTLDGLALDAEDGSLEANRLRWDVAGPVVRSTPGSSLSLSELAPGTYDITLTGTDRSDTTGSTTRRIEVLGLRVPEGSGVVLDGACSDNAYANAAFVRIPLGNGAFADVRLVHANGRLYVSFSDLPYGGPQSPTTVGVRVDVDASGGTVPLPGDLGFYVDQEGIPAQLVGNGTTMPPTLEPRLGYVTAVARGPGSWCAELCIDEALLGGWNHPARLLLHCERPGGETDGNWPPPGHPNAPQTWASAYLGTPAPLTNRPPVALAGPDQRVPVALPGTVYLDGGASYDPDQDGLVYAWTQVGGPAVALDSANTATPHFAVAPVSSPTPLRFRLVVSDGSASSAPDEVDVTLRPAAPPPRVVPLPKRGTVLANGSFLGCLTGDPEQWYEIQATTNLVDWTPIGGALSDFYGILTVLDADPARPPYRFYRGRRE